MKKINELSIKNKRRRLYRRIKVFIIMFIVIMLSNKLISNFKEISSLNNALVKSAYVESDNVTVILDPGHGGHDNGASFGSIYEKDIVLNIAIKVGEILEKNDIDVIYTRSKDLSLGDDEKEDLKSRVEISNSTNAEYFISFHINDYDTYSYGYEDIYGFEVWTDYNNYNSLILGRNIEESLDELNYTEKRPMLDGSEDLYIIRENNIPAVLIEFGFMNSADDRSYLSNKNNQELLAEAVASAIIKSIN